jgi:eukaryotic-like serine/threonine-protein kinase
MPDTEEGSPPSAITVGQELLDGRLVVLGLLGVGSMGVVYRAEDRRLGRQVALKTLRNFDADRLYQLKREFRTLARLSHPNLVQLYELGARGDVWFLIMELVDGVEMAQWLREKPDRDRVLRVFGELYEGLRVLHAAGQMHRDVKPSNVMITGSDHAVLLDFGLIAPIRPTATTMVAGTLDYIAPEQFWNQSPGAAADWYSFGVVLFEALTGQLPFAPSDRLRAMRHAPTAGPRALVPHLPAALDDVVRRLLDPDPARRPDPAELALVLNAPSTRLRAAPPVPQMRFVGRKEPLAQLHRHFEDVRHGNTRVVHVHGPSGIGKTSLLRHFLAEVRREGKVVVLEGGCHPQESVPYKALDALIDNLARHLLGLEDGGVVALAPRHAGDLVQLFPVLGRVPAVRQWPTTHLQLSPAEVRRRGFDALRELIGKIADEQPVVLWIDDIQWADGDSGPVLRALLTPPDAPRLLLILSSRDSHVAVPLIAAFDDSVPPVEIKIEPLSSAESLELARALALELGAAIDPESVANDSGGSPFLLGEMVRYLGESDSQEARCEPFNVAGLVRSRLGHLTPEARRLLEFVAVAGKPLETDLAFAVARVGPAGQLLAYALCAQCLLREGSQDERGYLETYHDRIREVAIAALEPVERQARHRDLADAIRRSRTPDARALVKHYLGAGDRAAGAHFALLAAEEAERDLAFDQSVEMYDLVLDLRADARADRALLERRARVLANAARRVEAALAYEEAAGAVEGKDQEEARTALRGKAAEQFFYGGELRKGLSVLQGVLDDLDVHVPAGPRGRLLSGQWLRGRFILRGCHVKPRDLDSTDSRVRARLDALWRATRGVVMLDHILADVLAGKHLLEALRLGDTSRALRAVALEAAFEANIGGRWFQRRSARLLRETERAAAQTGVPYDQAWLAHCRAVCAWFDGRWQECLRLGEVAEGRLKGIGVGVAWDLAVLQGFMLSALAHLGRLRELSTRLAALIADAERRQDQYALRVFRTGDAVTSWLVDDRVDIALRVADDTLGDYRTDQFTSQHRHHLVATVQIHLYAGDAAQAWSRVDGAWQPLRWSGFLLLDCLGTQLRYLRACSALALARTAGEGSKSLLAVASHEMGRIRRSTLPMAAPMAAAIEAGIAGAERRQDAQVTALRAACDGFDAAEMALHREASRWHLAALIPGGVTVRNESAGWMRREGIVSPASMARAVVPPA